MFSGPARNLNKPSKFLPGGKFGPDGQTPRIKKYERFPLKKESMPLAFQAPVPTVRKLEALGGNKSEHLRKALDLYMMVLKEESLGVSIPCAEPPGREENEPQGRVALSGGKYASFCNNLFINGDHCS